METKNEAPSETKRRTGRFSPVQSKQIIRWFAYTVLSGIILIIIVFVVINKYPSVGAKGADWLRNIIGDQGVVAVEMVVFSLQDKYQMLKYKLGMEPAEPGWGLSPVPTISPTIPAATTSPVYPITTPTMIHTSTVAPTMTAILPWEPATISPIIQAKGEGVWIPYIEDAQGFTVAYKAIVHPDTTRPYALTAIVGVDLTRTRLHFVLGSLEPAAPDSPVREVIIPETDRRAFVLLAEFNGGFQARHGQFGAMAGGVVALPPKNGLGTVVIYQDGTVQIGEWGTSVNMSEKLTAFRQNGPLVIDNGVISPRIYNNNPEDWGHTVDDVSPTARSGIGLSKDNKTLYYFSGYSLTMEGLANSMQAAGVFNAIQLDINNYWVLFVKITSAGSQLVPDPLVPWEMVADMDRYLHQSERDFFYITSITGK